MCFVIIMFFLDIEVPKTPIMAGLKAIDWVGVVLVSGGTVMFLLGLEYGGVTHPWDSATVICLIVFGIFVLFLFFLNEWKLAKYPVMPLRLFSQKSNIATLLVCFIHGVVFISAAYYLPLYFQVVLDATPILSGVYLLPFVLGLSFCSIFVGIFIKKTGQYLPPIWLGMTCMAIGFGLFVRLPVTRDWGRLVPFQLIAGFGVGPIFQAPLIALQSNVPPRDIATATSLFGFTRNLATSVSVVIGGVIFQNAMLTHKPELQAALPPALAARIGGGQAASSTGLVRQLPSASRVIVERIYNVSLQKTWIFYTAIAAVGVFVSFGITKKKLDTKHTEYKSGLQQEEANRLEQQQEDERRKLEREEKKRSKRASADSSRPMSAAALGGGIGADAEKRRSAGGGEKRFGGLKLPSRAGTPQSRRSEDGRPAAAPPSDFGTLPNQGSSTGVNTGGIDAAAPNAVPGTGTAAKTET